MKQYEIDSPMNRDDYIWYRGTIDSVIKKIPRYTLAFNKSKIGVVYAVEYNDNTFKIGCSSNPRARIRTHSKKSKFKSDSKITISRPCLNYKDLEYDIHSNLNHLNINLEFFGPIKRRFIEYVIYLSWKLHYDKFDFIGDLSEIEKLQNDKKIKRSKIKLKDPVNMLLVLEKKHDKYINQESRRLGISRSQFIRNLIQKAFF